MKKRCMVAFVLSLLMAAGSTGAAAGPIVERLGQWPYGPSTAVALDTSRSLAFVGAGGGIEILDVSDPEAPALMARIPAPDMVRGICFSFNYLFVAAGETGGLRLYNVAYPDAPEPGGWVDTPGTAEGVFVVDDMAYVADGGAGLRIINVVDRMAPREIGHFAANSVRDVYVDGVHAYLADGMAGLKILDVTDPAAPYQLGALETPGTAWAVQVAETFAYVADGSEGLYVVDVTDPAAPAEASVLAIDGYAQDLYVSGNLAYLAMEFGGMVIADVTPPAPVVKTVYTTPGPAQAIRLAPALGLAFVADGTGLRIIDVSTPSALSLKGAWLTPYQAEDVAAADGMACVADSAGILWILDATAPATPVAVGRILLPGGQAGRAVALAGSRAYVIAGANTLAAYDLTNPAAPTLLGDFSGLTEATDVAVVESRAYVADGAAGLKIINIANPAAMAPAGSVDTPGSASGVFATGSMVYVADGEAGLRIIDLMAEGGPAEVGFYDTGGNATAVTAIDGIALVADYAGGLLAIDIADPASPVLASSLQWASWAVDVQAAGAWAFVALYDGGIRVVDISDPAAIADAAAADTNGQATAVFATADRIYVADGDRGTAIYSFTPVVPTPVALAAGDVGTTSFTARWEPVAGASEYRFDLSATADFSNLAAGYADRSVTATQLAISGMSPATTYHYRLRAVRDGLASENSNVIAVKTESDFQTLGTWPNAAGDVLAVDAARRIVYLASGRTIYSLNASDAANVRQIGRFDAPATVRDMAHASDLLYVGADNMGLYIYDVSAPSSPVLMGSIGTDGEVRGVAVSGNRVYLADGIAGGMRVIDASDPTAPYELGDYGRSVSLDIAVSGDFAYLADIDGVRVVKITDPALPGEVGGLFMATPARKILVSGHHAYVLETAGLRIIDVSDPSKPVQAAFFPTPTAPAAIQVAYLQAYLLAGRTLWIFDVTDPANPRQTATHVLDGDGRDLAVAGAEIYVAGVGSGLTILRYAFSLDPPVALAPNDIAAHDFTARWEGVPGASGYRLDVATDEEFTTFVTGYNNLSVSGISRAVTGLTPDTVYWYQVRATISGSVSGPSNVIITCTDISRIPGDIDGNGVVDLTDAVIAISALAGIDTSTQIRPGYAESGADVNNDGRVGLAEAAFILRAVAGL